MNKEAGLKERVNLMKGEKYRKVYPKLYTDDKVKVTATFYEVETGKKKLIKVKWCIYNIAPFPYEDAQRRFTMISLPPADRKQINKISIKMIGCSFHWKIIIQNQ